MNILDLDGRVALVTGAGAGVGRAACRHMAAYGAKGIIVNDVRADAAEKVAAEINKEYGPGVAVGLAADVTDYAAVEQMVEQGRERFGSVDILVNNAGNFGADPSNVRFEPFWNQSPENWEPWIGANLMGVMNCTRAVTPGMVEARYGSIITMISDAARVGEASLEVYGAAKAGAAGLTRGLAKSLGKHNVRINNVAISAVKTQATKMIWDNEDAAKKVLKNYVLRRFGEPEDIANMILFLASDASSWVTGQTYPVNGGFSFAA